MTVKKELKYFNIGKSYGGNQNWMLDPWMHIGGCAALTTCDVCIYLALYKGMKDLYPYDINKLSRTKYTKFGMSMKLYLQPRETGIKDLDTYIDGTMAYFEDIEATDISLSGISGETKCEEARDAIRNQIDEGLPIPYLMLKHKDHKFNFFEWHWFLVNGYEERKDDFYIKVATYGKEHWLPFAELWDTGYEEKGGIVKICLTKS